MGSGLQAQTVREAISEVTKRFRAARLVYGHGTTGPHEEAAWIVLHACKLPFEALEEAGSRVLSNPERRRVDTLAARRIRERIPAAYLIHEAWLGDFRFYVDRRVIVPRSYIAEILDDGIGTFLASPVKTALDLCTGSGCLAILLAHAFPAARIDAVDLSKAALAVAKRNIDAYDLGRRLHAIHSDLFQSMGNRRYDLIVSNPPYVNAVSMKRLPREFLAEPRMALAAGSDDLTIVRRILASARRHLKPRGVLVCEIGHNRKVLEQAFPELPFIWMETSAGDGLVFLIEKDHLPA